jgi:GAF domain-containing protein
MIAIPMATAEQSPPPAAGTMPTRASVQQGAAALPGRRLLDRAADDCRAEEATLWLISDDRQQMDGTLNHGRTPHLLESLSVPVPQSVVGMVASIGVGASIGPDDYHHPAPTQAGAAGTHAMIAVPVLVGGHLVGVLSAINPRGGGLFSPDDLEKLSFNAYLLGLVLADTHGL